MLQIPPAKDTDAEDVVWGLQTAETLWKRGERIDALVWLRRAAQAAGDASDDDRALELARHAAELTDLIASAPESEPPAVMPSTGLVEEPPIAIEVDAVVDEGRPSTASVLPADRVHAGMYDPWAESSDQAEDSAITAVTEPPLALATEEAEEEEILTSLRPEPLSQPARSEVQPGTPARPGGGSPPQPKPPPLPPRARPAAPKPSLPVAAPPPSAPPAPVAAPPAPVAAPPAPVAAPPPPVASKLDLDAASALADLPDDAREAFAAAATMHTLAEGEEVGAFALAYVVSGAFDVAATVVDAPAVRIGGGAVLRARGTTEVGVPMRLISASSEGVVATWSDEAVDEAFRTCPWVEDDLRAEADRVQTLVGITIGPLGERLDVAIREEVVSRLTMRPLAPHEVLVQTGEPVPGLILVGVGELELVADAGVTGAVGSGEFLFPTEVLGAGAAPATARAGTGGALIMFGDRAIAQELLVTCPPLLEVFAGM